MNTERNREQNKEPKINLCIYSQENVSLVNVLRTYINWINNDGNNKIIIIIDFSINGTRKLAPNL